MKCISVVQNSFQGIFVSRKVKMFSQLVKLQFKVSIFDLITALRSTLHQQ